MSESQSLRSIEYQRVQSLSSQFSDLSSVSLRLLKYHFKEVENMLMSWTDNPDSDRVEHFKHVNTANDFLELLETEINKRTTAVDFEPVSDSVSVFSSVSSRSFVQREKSELKNSNASALPENSFSRLTLGSKNPSRCQSLVSEKASLYSQSRQNRISTNSDDPIHSEYNEFLADLTKPRSGNCKSAKSKLLPPSFDGRVVNWRRFLSEFKYHIKTCSISEETDIFDRLKTCIPKDAASLLNPIPLIDGCLFEAYKRLTRRFDKPIEARADLLAQLKITKKITSCENLEALRNLMDLLTTLQTEFDLWETNQNYLVSYVFWEIRSKLPDEMIGFLHMNQIKSIEDFIILIDEKYNEQSSYKDDLSHAQDKVRAYLNSKSKKSDLKSSLTVSAVTSKPKVKKEKKERKYPCAFCKDDHFPSRCQKYIGFDIRIAQVREVKLCEVCLKPLKEHKNSKCTENPFCKICKKNGHYMCLCPEQKAEITKKISD